MEPLQYSVNCVESDCWDWDSYYEKHPPPRNQVQSGKRVARRIERFIESKGLTANSIADVGCGPATTIFDLARRMPRCDFRGYDSSRTILRMNRQKAEKLGLDNLHFHFTKLPAMAVRRRFSIVMCIATLHYVEDPRRAIRRLYSMVEPGGCLVFNYPNRAHRAAVIREAEHDPVVTRRFELVIRGGNLLSYSGIERKLGRRPRSFWLAVGEPASRVNPCVVIAK
jgi:2-polyprenyl-3-methyl-5-hydroxy-6-metoxy-1,4-benzoquinol methylase